MSNQVQTPVEVQRENLLFRIQELAKAIELNGGAMARNKAAYNECLVKAMYSTDPEDVAQYNEEAADHLEDTKVYSELLSKNHEDLNRLVYLLAMETDTFPEI